MTVLPLRNPHVNTQNAVSAQNVPARRNRRRFPLFTEHAVLQWVTNRWASVLSPSEGAMVMAVFSRTIAWGKFYEIIPMRHLTDGIRSRDGTLRYAGLNLSRKTLSVAANRLVREGFLLRRAFGRTWQYSLNVRAMTTDADPYLMRRAAQVVTREEQQRMRRARRLAIRAAERRYRETGSAEDREIFMALLNGDEREAQATDNVVALPVQRRDRRAPGEENGQNGEPEGEQEGQQTLGRRRRTCNLSTHITEQHTPSGFPSENTEATRQARLPLRRESSPPGITVEGSHTPLPGGETSVVARGTAPPAAPPAPVLPTARATGPRTRRGATAPTEQAADWRERTRRTRRTVLADEVTAPVLEYGRALPDAAGHARSGAVVPLPDTAPAPHAPAVERALTDALEAGTRDETLTGVLQRAMSNAERSSNAKRRRRHLTAEAAEEIWANTIAARNNGTRPPAWAPHQRVNMRRIMDRVPLPDPTMRWGILIEYVARFWGEATSLAVPFMLRDDNRREGILEAWPSVSLFQRFAQEYVTAYATLFHGAGHTPEDEERARQDRRLHDRWCERAVAVARDGYDRLAPQHMRNDEVQDMVQRLAGDDAEAERVLALQLRYSAMARQLARSMGDGWRDELRARIAAERYRQHQAQARANETDEDRAFRAMVDELNPDMDMSGYFEDE